MMKTLLIHFLSPFFLVSNPERGGRGEERRE
jgi:hypothetical protein